MTSLAGTRRARGGKASGGGVGPLQGGWLGPGQVSPSAQNPQAVCSRGQALGRNRHAGHTGPGLTFPGGAGLSLLTPLKDESWRV